MSEDERDPRREDGDEEEPDFFDSLEDPDRDIEDPFAELGEDADASDDDSGSTSASHPGFDDADDVPESATEDVPESATEDVPDDVSSPASGGHSDVDWEADFDESAGGAASFDAVDEPAADRDDPFDDLTGEWDDEMGDLDDAFEQMDVGASDSADVWESLDADTDPDVGGGAAGTGAADTGGSGLGETASAGGDEEHVVSKRTYCQECPHFTKPPEVACTHEGTTIVESIGFTEFRVRNCPMISEEDPTFDGGN